MRKILLELMLCVSFFFVFITICNYKQKANESNLFPLTTNYICKSKANNDSLLVSQRFSNAIYNETLEFYYNGKVFSYQLSSNIKHSKQFDINYQINKYNRFASKESRKEILLKMIQSGFDEQIAINYIFPNLENTFKTMEKTINIKPKNASLSIDSNSSKVFNLSKETIGVEMDKIQLYKDICKNYLNDKNLVFKIPTKKIQPEILAKDYKKYTNLRADFSTDISSSSPDRKHNIKNALLSLNKLEIYPNQVFSFNSIIGKRTKENGYREAKIIVNNEFVSGVGGGVCQVSTTLYNSALLAGLEILEANKHSKQVGYVKYGFDAMVNFGSSDLKFRNNTKEKIIIITNYTPNKTRIRIFGESLDNVEYKLSNEIVSLTHPSEDIIYDTKQEYLDKIEYEDEYFYLKKATVGMEIKTFRETYINGVLSKKELLRFDKFKAQNAVKIYGTKKRTVNQNEF